MFTQSSGQTGLSESLTAYAAKQRLIVVAAHPDDEVLAIGGQFTSLHPRMFHITTGSFGIDRLARLRQRELNKALRLARIPLRHRFSCNVSDQQAIYNLPKALADLLSFVDHTGVNTLLTHAYEGGHPDHDAAALLCSLARNQRPHLAIHEFPSYNNGTPFGPLGTWRTATFLESTGKELTVHLSPGQQRKKARLLRCFRTQASVLRRFQLSPERLRPAPEYRFSKPPHPGTLLYEAFGWTTFQSWVRAANQGLQEVHRKSQQQ